MYTLYLDTHMDKIILVIYQDEKIKLQKEVVASHNHSVSTIPLLVSALEEINLDIHDLNQIIVVNGPGSFTGVRLGVTIAKTLAYTLEIPIKVFSSLLIKAVSFDHSEVVILEREKNGVFLGKFSPDNKALADYTYLKNSEYEAIANLSYVEDVKVDYEKIIKFAKSLPSINPHAVNPLYVKKIEVEK